MGVTYTDATARTETIAHWTKINRQSLADSDDLSARINDRLVYGVLTPTPRGPGDRR